MNADDLLRLTRTTEKPSATGTAAENDDLIALLQGQRRSGRVALYASVTHGMTSILVHSVLVETLKLAGDLQGIVDWEGNPYDTPSCSLVTGGGQPARVEMFHPWRERQPATLIGAVQLVFARAFDAKLGEHMYFELSQDLTLAHGLHWLEEKQAWFKFDENGEIVALAGSSALEMTGTADRHTWSGWTTTSFNVTCLPVTRLWSRCSTPCRYRQDCRHRSTRKVRRSVIWKPG